MANAPIQVTHNPPREGREEDPEPPDTGVEEEEQPTGDTAQEQRKEETHGNSISEVLKGLRRKLEEGEGQGSQGDS